MNLATHGWMKDLFKHGSYKVTIALQATEQNVCPVKYSTFDGDHGSNQRLTPKRQFQFGGKETFGSIQKTDKYRVVGLTV